MACPGWSSQTPLRDGPAGTPFAGRDGWVVISCPLGTRIQPALVALNEGGWEGGRQTVGVPTLRSLLDVMAPALEAITGEEGLDREVQEVVLVGPGDPMPDLPGALLMCTDPSVVGSAPRTAGVVVKPHPDDRDALTRLGVPVLVAGEDLPWNHLLHLLTTAVTAATRSGDLFALANAIAAHVGGAVAIEDTRRRVLAYSSLADQPIDEVRQRGILGRQVPDLPRNDDLYRALQRSAGVVRCPRDGDVLPRMAVGVRSGAELLGSIWVVESTPLGPEAEQALLDASRLAALHLLRARSGNEAERRARGELLRGLLDGRSSPDLVASRLAIDATAPVTVVAVAMPAKVGVDELETEALADLVHVQCAALSPNAGVLVQSRVLYALVPGALPRPRLVQLAVSVVERARTARKVVLRAAVGATVEGIAHVQRSRTDADAVLRLIGPGTAAAVEELLPQVVLLDLRQHLAAHPHLRLPALHALLEHDAHHGTPYADTVRAYLAANADVPAAADAVTVHANTFRYRLRRVRELFGLDLDDPDVRLVTWLQLRTRT